MTTREMFGAAVRVGRTVLGEPAVGGHWDDPSALAEMSVGALAAHLLRAVTSVDGYLDQPPAGSGEGLDAPGYFLSIAGLAVESPADLESALHQAVRTRAAEESQGGHAAVLRQWDAVAARLEERLAAEPPDRIVPVLGGRLVHLDHYLVTRMVELVVHTDDLAVSVGVDSPVFPEAVVTAVVECLVTIARRRHGDIAVVRALTRRERDAEAALRVL